MLYMDKYLSGLGFSVVITRSNVKGYTYEAEGEQSGKSLAIFPVEGSALQSLANPVWVGHYDADGELLHDTEYDTLEEFLRQFRMIREVARAKMPLKKQKFQPVEYIEYM